MQHQRIGYRIRGFYRVKVFRIPKQEYTAEFMELSCVRSENARLRMENEILKKATAYFAKDVL